MEMVARGKGGGAMMEMIARVKRERRNDGKGYQRKKGKGYYGNGCQRNKVEGQCWKLLPEEKGGGGGNDRNGWIFCHTTDNH